MTEKQTVPSDINLSFFHGFHGIAMVRSDTAIILITGAVHAITGYSEKELLEATPPWDEIIHRADITAYTQNLSQLHDQYRIVTKKGKTCWVLEQRSEIEHNEQPLIKSIILNIDSCKRSEIDCIESQKKSDMILDAVNDGIWEWHIPSGRALFNHRWFTMLGYEPDEFEQSFVEWEKLLHPEDSEKVNEAIQSHLENNLPFDIEFRMKNKAGKWQWILGKGRIVERNNQGKPIRMVGTHVNIHSFKEMEQELEKKVMEQTAQLRRFYNAVESSPASIVITDIDGNIEYTNPFFTHMTGYTREEAHGENPRLLKSQFHEPSFYKKMWDTLLTKKTWRGEICNKKKDGTYYWEDCSISPLLDQNGTIINFIAVKGDITKTKNIALQLEESETRYRTMFNASRDGILISDNETKKFKYVNKAMSQLLGYTSRELESMDVVSIHPKENLDYVVASFEKQARGELSYAVELPCLRKDGTVVYCDVSAAPIDIDGKPSVMGFFRNATERLETEKIKQDIEQIMRHDLKNPLNAIITIPDIIIDEGAVTPDFQEYLHIIRDSGIKMLAMINLSLDLYKMEMGTYTYKPALVDIVKTTGFVIATLQSQTVHKNNSIIASVNNQSLSDAQQYLFPLEELLFFSMMSNLITNAIEASPQNAPVTITVSISDQLVITIHNSGMVPEEIQDRFFDKYITAKKKTGTGLGTYSAKLIATTMGGTITMSTDSKKGTVVTITLPYTEIIKS